MKLFVFLFEGLDVSHETLSITPRQDYVSSSYLSTILSDKNIEAVMLPYSQDITNNILSLQLCDLAVINLDKPYEDANLFSLLTLVWITKKPTIVLKSIDSTTRKDFFIPHHLLHENLSIVDNITCVSEKLKGHLSTETSHAMGISVTKLDDILKTSILSLLRYHHQLQQRLLSYYPSLNTELLAFNSGTSGDTASSSSPSSSGDSIRRREMFPSSKYSLLRDDRLNPFISLPSGLTYRHIYGRFPVEIVGIDCARLTDAVIVDLKFLIETHNLVIIRDQNLMPEEQIKLTSFFGIPAKAWDNRNRDSDFPEIQIISNQFAGGSYHYSRRKMSTVRFWHTDTSFLEEPTRYTFLYGKALPESGGDTKFIDTQLAYESLAPEYKILTEGKFTSHSFNAVFGELLRDRRLEREERIEDVSHPLIMQDGDKKSIYLSKLAVSHILDMPEEDSERLLTQLYEHCKQDVFRYRHSWQTGDLLLWDNLRIMHKGTFADPISERTLHRTTTNVCRS